VQIASLHLTNTALQTLFGKRLVSVEISPILSIGQKNIDKDNNKICPRVDSKENNIAIFINTFEGFQG
jgi:hypothetical protein